MTNQEAKFILGAYRPDGRDASEAAFGEAVGQARSDPALGQWFARSQALDVAVALKLSAIAPPPGLREAILAGGRVSAVSRPWWGRPAWIAVAACAAAGIALAVAWNRDGADARTRAFARFALQDTAQGGHGGHGEANGVLGRWLETSGAPLAFSDMPADFEKLRATGCRTVEFSGHDVLEICFDRGQGHFHLYMLRRGDAPEFPAAPKPHVLELAGSAAAVWTDARYAYALVSETGAGALKTVL
jgi:hypothetical protein